MKILIIEDERDIALPVKEVLEAQGYSVDAAFDGEKGLSLFKLNKYDCVLLDLNLPKIDGLTVAKLMRQKRNSLPIIMVTARGQMDDKLTGFKTGADDYVSKPFDLRELLARIKAVIVRSQHNKAARLLFDDGEFLPESNKVVWRKRNKIVKEVKLSTKETGVLEYLLRNKNKIISTEGLLEHVWDSNFDELTETVKTHIKTLRQKIDPRKQIIQTVRNKGYMIEG